MNESLQQFPGHEVYNHQLMEILLPIFDVTSTLTFIFTVFLIIAITTKTPKSMKNFKVFLLPYACFTLAVEILLGLYCPAVLHPFVYLYPAGFARYLPPNVSVAVLTLAFYSAISTIDCCIAMTLERYYAMRNMQSAPSRMPLIIYGILASSSFISMVFILIITQIPSLSNHFIVPFDTVPTYISTQISGLEAIINVRLIIIFRDAAQNKIPLILIMIIIVAFTRVSAAFIILYLNIRTSRSLKSKISPKLQRHNEMLLRMTYTQLIGFAILLGIPLFAILYVCIFVTEPSFIATYGFAVMNFFGLYDSIATAICIKPYRKFLVLTLKLGFYRRKNVSRIHTQVL